AATEDSSPVSMTLDEFLQTIGRSGAVSSPAPVPAQEIDVAPAETQSAVSTEVTRNDAPALQNSVPVDIQPTRVEPLRSTPPQISASSAENLDLHTAVRRALMTHPSVVESMGKF